MRPKWNRGGFRPFAACCVAGLLGLVVSTEGQTGEALFPRDHGPALLALDTQGAVSRPAAGPRVSYDVSLLTTDDLFGIDFHHNNGVGREAVGLAFLSDLERRILLEAAGGLPSSRLVQRNATAADASGVTFVFPHGVDPDLDVNAPVTALAVSGSLEGKSIRLTIRLAEGALPVARRGVEADGGRELRCTIPNGGIVLLHPRGDVNAAENPKRLILVIPRRHASGVEARVFPPAPG